MSHENHSKVEHCYLSFVNIVINPFLIEASGVCPVSGVLSHRTQPEQAVRWTPYVRGAAFMYAHRALVRLQPSREMIQALGLLSFV